MRFRKNEITVPYFNNLFIVAKGAEKPGNWRLVQHKGASEVIPRHLICVHFKTK